VVEEGRGLRAERGALRSAVRPARMAEVGELQGDGRVLVA
jgi:hypothetical protein